jgi:hypothetical protein
VPEIAEADGTGKRAKFSVRNLVELAFIKALVESGTDLRSAKNIKGLLDENRDEFDGGNAFDFALKTLLPDAFKMWLYRAGNKRFMARVVGVKPNADVDFDDSGPKVVPGEFELYINRHVDERPDMGYVSIQIDIGDLAKEIVLKLKQV